MQQALSYKTETNTNIQNALFALFQVLGGSCLIALSAQIVLPLPFTPVPVSLQTLAVAIVALFLGRVKGSLSVVFYLAQICMALPVKAGGISDPLALVGPTGGYLMGMVVQAYLIGYVLEGSKNLMKQKMFAALIISSFVQLAMGSLWLANFAGLSFAFSMGFAPFVVGEVFKAMIASSVFLKLK